MKNKKIIYASAIIGAVTLGGISTFAALNLFGKQDIGHSLQDGHFFSDGTGNAGTVDLTQAGRNDMNLEGKVTIQSIGIDNDFAGKLVTPTGNVNVTRLCWRLQGYITTKNAGNITLTGSQTDLWYNPVTNLLEWYAYNRNLGKVHLWDVEYCEDGKIEDEELQGIVKEGKNSRNFASFIGRVKVMGSIGAGKTIFDHIYEQDKWVNFARYTQVLQDVRKNIAILSRNISEDNKNTDFKSTNSINGTIFYVNNEATPKLLELEKIPENIRQIVVIGGNVVIRRNIEKSSQPTIVVAVQNAHNAGGNIYIHKDVTNIYSSLLAENSILSGEWVSGDNELYNDTPEEIASLPKNQLHIYGSIFSYNTIGGASFSLEDPVCPYLGDKECTRENAQIYDFNYFRAFDPRDVDSGKAKRAISVDSFNNYSLIIEHDTRLTQDAFNIFTYIK